MENKPLKLAFICAIAFLSLSIGVSVYGYFHQSLDLVAKWNIDIRYQFFYLLLIAFVFLSHKNFIVKKDLKKHVSIISLLSSLFILGISETAVLTAFVLSSTIYGSKIRKLLPYPPDVESTNLCDKVISYAVGQVFLMYILGVAAHFSINNVYTHTSLYLIPFLFFKTERNDLYSSLTEIFTEEVEKLTLREVFAFAIFLTLSFCYLLFAALPEIFHDATSVYFPIAVYLKEKGMWHFDPAKAVFGTMSFAAVWVEASLFRLGGEIAAKMSSFISTMSTAILIYGILRRESSSRLISILMSNLFLSTSVIFLISVSMFYDAQLMLLITACFYLICNPKNKFEFSSLILLAAGAISIKISGLFPVSAVIVFVIYHLWFNKKLLSSKILVPISIGLLIALPAYIYSYVKTGNPFFPFMNGIFKSPLIESNNLVSPLIGKLSPKILYDMTFKTNEYLESSKGGFGFHFLILLPFVFWNSLFTKKTNLIILSLISIPFIVIQLKMDHNVRYTTQFMPIFLCLIGVIVSSLKLKFLQNFLLSMIIIVTFINWYFLASSTGPLINTSVFTALNPSQVETFKKNFVSQKLIADNIASSFPTRPLTVSLNAGGLSTAETDVRYNNWYNGKLFNALVNSTNDAEIDQTFKEWGITHVIERQDNEYYNREVLHRYLEKNFHSKTSLGSNIAYRLKDEVILSKEYTVNSYFDSKVDNWELSQVVVVNKPFSGAKILPGGYISQNFSSFGRKIFRLKIEFSCSKNQQIMTSSIGFSDSKGSYFAGERWDTICQSAEKIETFEREFESPNATSHVRLAAGSFNIPIKFDSIKLTGSEKALD